MIELRSVTKRYGDEGPPALDGLSLRVPSGTTLCLIGASGSGKTTALRVVNRLVEPSSGTVHVGGVNVAGLDPVELRRGIGYVIQRGGLFPHLSVARNIGLLARLMGWDEGLIADRVDALLAMVQLDPGLASRRPRELSGGQRQRVGVARALMLDPPILLMDEPFGALDPVTRDRIQGELGELLDEQRKTTLIVTHDLGEAFRLGDRVALLEAGRLVALGTEGELRRSDEPRVRAFMDRGAR